ncbi:MAG: hypothetical protein B0D91_07670 [Oceanospirillales bacterium LUC14_002_19_P2]|nr:MAG: hypothetical protein B0D91_07670 [Oceanospirillales bacterium LUC14_002_19_P2]
MSYVTDLRHLPEDPAQIQALPEPARLMTVFITSIVAELSQELSLPIINTDVKCKSRNTTSQCSGCIDGWVNPEGVLVWACDRCADNGFISNWEGTIWDNQARTTH